MLHNPFDANRPIGRNNFPKPEPSLQSLANQLDHIEATLQSLSARLSALERKVSHIKGGNHFNDDDNNLVIDPKTKMMGDLPLYRNQF